MQQSFPSYYPQQGGHSSKGHDHTCSKSQAEAYYTPQNIQYPQHDQNLYQYGEGDGYMYQSGAIQPYPYQEDTPPGIFAEWFNFSDACYLKGFLVGAGITFLVTNPTIQKAVVRGVINLMSVVQGGVEEVKEQIKDIKAEMSQKD